MSRVAVSLVVLAMAFAVVGCGGDGDGPGSLAGTSWVLVEGIDVPADATVTMPTAAFTGDEISGTGGCNRYSASYTVDGDGIEIGPIAMTQIGCPAPTDRIETDFFAALDQAAEWEIDDDELVLSAADGGDSLRFEPAAAS